MHRGTAFLTMLALLLVTVPSGTAQEETEVRQDILSQEGKDITFYGHIFDVQRSSPMPMNTQFPVGESDFSRGWGGACGSYNGVPLDVNSDGSVYTCEEDFDRNENFWYTTAGFVQIKDSDEWTGYDQFHNERGQTKDIYFDTSMPATATYYLSADFHGWSTALCAGACWNWDPGYFQDFVVDVTVYHASLGDWSSDPSAKPDMGPIVNQDDSVTVVAYGQSEPTDIMSIDETIDAPVCEGACRTVTPFVVDLEWDQDFAAAGGIVPYQNDLIVKFEWFQKNGDETYILSTPTGVVWNANSGEDYPANIVFPTRNPIDVELVFPRFVHDKLVVLSIINTPWGSYDIDNKMTQLIIKDAAGNVVDIDPETLQSDVDSSVAHAGHYKPINATWVWDYQAQGLEPGEYTVEVEVTNFQHSHTTSTVAAFTLDDEGSGTTTAGRSGLASYSDSDFKAFKEGAGIGEGTDDQEVEPADEGDPDESQGSPGFAALAVILLMPAIALFLRRRSP